MRYDHDQMAVHSRYQVTDMALIPNAPTNVIQTSGQWNKVISLWAGLSGLEALKNTCSYFTCSENKHQALQMAAGVFVVEAG